MWRQDHNGFSHQDPGFIDHVVNKKAEIIRIYLPPDANCLLSVTDHCLRSRNYVNVVVAGKQPAPVWLAMDQAIGTARPELASGNGPAAIRATNPTWSWPAAATCPLSKRCAAVESSPQARPDLKVRVVNVVDLMKLQPPEEHPHGLPEERFRRDLPTDRPIIFAFHGYPWLIHRLAYRRTNHENLHVRGYTEEEQPPRPSICASAITSIASAWSGTLSPRPEVRRSWRVLRCRRFARASGPYMSYIARRGDVCPNPRLEIGRLKPLRDRPGRYRRR